MPRAPVTHNRHTLVQQRSHAHAFPPLRPLRPQTNAHLHKPRSAHTATIAYAVCTHASPLSHTSWQPFPSAFNFTHSHFRPPTHCRTTRRTCRMNAHTVLRKLQKPATTSAVSTRPHTAGVAHTQRQHTRTPPRCRPAAKRAHIHANTATAASAQPTSHTRSAMHTGATALVNAYTLSYTLSRYAPCTHHQHSPSAS